MKYMKMTVTVNGEVTQAVAATSGGLAGVEDD